MTESGGEPTIGVLGLHTSKETKAILNAVEALGYGTEWLRRENTAVSITDGDLEIEPSVDVVINRLLVSNSTHPEEYLGLARTFARAAPMLNPPGAVATAVHKFAAAVALTEADVPVPDALLALSGDRLNADRARFGDRAVYKTAIGTHGGGAWMVDLDRPLNPQVGDRQAFLQRLLERPGETPQDLRVYVVDGDVIGAMYRSAPEGEWRTNVSLGGAVTNADDLSPDAHDIAVRAAEIIGLDYAGVDLISDGEGWYVLEVNPTAGFRGLFESTGTSPAPYIAQLAIERAGGTVDDDRVETLAETLDDSMPTCAPENPDPQKPPESLVIGYIEEVVVSGSRGSKLVAAKSDTGAGRTSIDARLAAEVGTGPITEVVTVRSGSSKRGKSRPVVDIVVGVGGTQHTVSASVEDRSHMNYDMLLGRDILQHYHVDVTRRSDERETTVEE